MRGVESWMRCLAFRDGRVSRHATRLESRDGGLAFRDGRVSRHATRLESRDGRLAFRDGRVSRHATRLESRDGRLAFRDGRGSRHATRLESRDGCVSRRAIRLESRDGNARHLPIVRPCWIPLCVAAWRLSSRPSTIALGESEPPRSDHRREAGDGAHALRRESRSGALDLLATLVAAEDAAELVARRLHLEPHLGGLGERDGGPQ